MASQIESMFTSIHSKIDEEYIRNNFTEEYGKVDLNDISLPIKYCEYSLNKKYNHDICKHRKDFGSYFKSHPQGGWFIKIIEYDVHNCPFKKQAVAIDNYGKIYYSHISKGNYYILNENLVIDNNLYKFPNSIIEQIINNLDNVYDKYISYHSGYGGYRRIFNHKALNILSIFQNLAKDYHIRFNYNIDTFNQIKEKYN